MYTGIDVGGTNTKIGVVDAKGHIYARKVIPTEADQSFESFESRLHQAVLELWEPYRWSNCEGIGVGAPNYSSRRGILVDAPNLDWGEVALQHRLQTLFQKPVFVENDANAAALGERVYGRGGLDFILVTLGTGIGTGVFSQGRLVIGAKGLGGEGGHLVVDTSQNARICGCGGRGHLESYASVPGIKQTYLETFGQSVRFSELWPRFVEGDADAKVVMQKTAHWLAFGLSQMATLFDPNTIFLAGGGALVGQAYADMVQKAFDGMVYAPMKGIRIALSSVSAYESACLGAAALAVEGAQQ